MKSSSPPKAASPKAVSPIGPGSYKTSTTPEASGSPAVDHAAIAAKKAAEEAARK